ncbi:MAG: alpha-glucan family phosphorylase [Phycisphaerales bacterium]|nr:alpha-glucan family phosphorylase [Phycisphaerales bacterium]
MPHAPRFPSIAVDDLVSHLRDLASNVWWSWNEEGWSVFQTLDPTEWRATNHSPLGTLERTTAARIAALACDPIFVKRVYDGLAARAAYLGERAWFQRGAGAHRAGFRVGYFCSEYGLHESIQQYAGGLGILAGDHLKSASDLGIPLVAMGLAYRHGYYIQQLARDGSTQVLYPEYDFARFGIEDTRITIGCPIGSRIVTARVLRLWVGRVPLYLLDTDLKANAPDDRKLTEGLYKGDPLLRLRQQVLLGVGGMMALKALGEKVTVLHLNEGHAAFAALQRAVDLHSTGRPIQESFDVVRRATVFTTHTPVPAGHDRYDPKMVCEELATLAARAGLSQTELADLGRINAGDEEETFCMTVLALRLSQRVNGVSQLHGEVSRDMWKKFYRVGAAKVPIGSITNGVHVKTWIDPDAERFWQNEIALRLGKQAPKATGWSHAKDADPARFWELRERLRSRLVHFVRDRMTMQCKRRGEGQSAVASAYSLLDDGVLTIGFARRFATYKRAPLIFHDPKRLAQILSSSTRPVQIVFAGKAHPRDEAGQAFAQRVFSMTRDPMFAGRVAFVEEYDMHVGRMLTSGADVWLNTPTRPYEASGTSGMKPPLHGGLNLSILDGWWPEAADGINGWSIGSTQTLADAPSQDASDVESLYRLLEESVVPQFYERDANGLPQGWIARALHSAATVPPEFNSHRMVAQYTRKAYLPAHSIRGS